MAAAKYRTIVADPPWDHSDGYGKRAQGWYCRGFVAPLPYSAMALSEITDLPIAELADDDCRLFLWTTNRYLPASFGVMAEWGFTYRQTLVWHKTNASPFSGSVAFGSAEFLVVGTCGNPAVVTKAHSSVLSLGHHHDHSRKPEAFLDLVEVVSPGPYLEMFARRQRIGWDSWGNECRRDVEMEVS